MKFQNKTITLLLFVLVALQGCSSKMDRLPGIDVNSNKTNTDFIIYEDLMAGSANTHTNNKFLAINVKNLTDSQIEFSAGFVSLFTKTDDGWVKISNLMRRPEFAVRLPTTEDFPPGMIVTVIPWIPGMEKATTVRIFFVGQNVDTDEKVGAFWDFDLYP
jgi:hypothetical protein